MRRQQGYKFWVTFNDKLFMPSFTKSVFVCNTYTPGRSYCWCMYVQLHEPCRWNVWRHVSKYRIELQISHTKRGVRRPKRWWKANFDEIGTGIMFPVHKEKNICNTFEVCYLTTLVGLRLHSVDNRMINECGAVGGMRIGRGNRSTRRKPAPIPLRPPQIPHDLTWDRSRATAVGNRRLTAWAMGRSFYTTDACKWIRGRTDKLTNKLSSLT
jgi:hypothetical protein